ncbi:hypothetical protein [Plantactinospora sonchi]|uniref:ABC transporter n=1 Tax=Plantactinospora sonchi TaxID=1544735 RepID=A0ABU7RV19_9ACTN
MIPLVVLRLTGFVRTARALPPLLAGLLALVVLHGGAGAPPAEAYGVSAVILFPVLAWQTRLLLDTEPDVQRRLAVVAAGRRTELVAGLLAAATAGLALVVIALVVPWLVGGVSGPDGPGGPSVGQGLAVGLWAHLLVLPPAVGLGALSSRAAVASPLSGLAVLVCGVVCAFVFGLRDSVVPWLVPPVLAVARTSTAGPTAMSLGLVTGHAVLWSAVVITGYAWLRRRQA